MAKFKEGSRPGQLRVSVNGKVLVQNVDAVAAHEGGLLRVSEGQGWGSGWGSNPSPSPNLNPTEPEPET